ncbi:FecR family protein [Pedobacter nutrimenti]|uniref:FecR family protein n=1 Tax=Pedobacter nutrimenti TaxID=1241337 RepID=UPI00292F33C6|nr:FecR domain-containing protein [Pedobacter nutrimenti]
MDKLRIQYLHDRYLQDTLSKEEWKEWEGVLLNPAAENLLQELVYRTWDNMESEDKIRLAENRSEEIFAGISDVPQTAVRQLTLWPRIAASAAIILLTGAGLFYYKNRPAANQQSSLVKQDIKPGGNKAYLTLANGKKIALIGAQNGALAKQGAITINKTLDGQLVYTAAATAAQNSELVTYNSIETPRGGEYRLTLADGTKVWLNAASSIKYPVAFAGKERKVEITGNVYFEVEHNAAKPFRVICNGQIVEDLGTHFNINAYSDENAVKTTLLEGSVKISSAGKAKILKPGEQAQLVGGNILVTQVNVDEVVAWKNGLFDFKDADIETIMRQLSRWYDVDVEYRGKISEALFTGKLYREVNVSQVLDMLSYFKVHFKIENDGVQKKIVVMP